MSVWLSPVHPPPMAMPVAWFFVADEGGGGVVVVVVVGGGGGRGSRARPGPRWPRTLASPSCAPSHPGPGSLPRCDQGVPHPVPPGPPAGTLARVRVLFVSENLAGNATMHRHIRAVLADRPDVDASFVEVPRRRLVRRAFAGHVPGLARADLDFAALRDQLAGSLLTERLLR